MNQSERSGRPAETKNIIERKNNNGGTGSEPAYQTSCKALNPCGRSTQSTLPHTLPRCTLFEPLTLTLYPLLTHTFPLYTLSNRPILTLHYDFSALSTLPTLLSPAYLYSLSTLCSLSLSTFSPSPISSLYSLSNPRALSRCRKRTHRKIFRVTVAARAQLWLRRIAASLKGPKRRNQE